MVFIEPPKEIEPSKSSFIDPSFFDWHKPFGSDMVSKNRTQKSYTFVLWKSQKSKSQDIENTMMGSKTGHSYVDITLEKDGVVKRIQTVDIDRFGNPTKREADALSRISKQKPADILEWFAKKRFKL